MPELSPRTLNDTQINSSDEEKLTKMPKEVQIVLSTLTPFGEWRYAFFPKILTLRSLEQRPSREHLLQKI